MERLRYIQGCCRLCLCEKLDNLKPVFDEITEDTSLPRKILKFLGIEINTTDKTSTMVCNKCITKIDDWDNYKRQCILNQNKLDERLSCPSNNIAHMSFHIKEESAEKLIETENDTVDALPKNEPIDPPAESMEEECEELPPPLLIPQPNDDNQDSENSTDGSVRVLDPATQQNGLPNAPKQIRRNPPRLSSDNKKVQSDASPKPEAKYSCTPCNKFYSRSSGIWAHNKKVHPEKKTPFNSKFPMQCKVCDKVIGSSSAHFRHKKIHENDRIPVEGDTTTPIKMPIEEDTKEEQSYHTCVRCFKVFSTKYSLRSHMKCHGKKMNSPSKNNKKISIHTDNEGAKLDGSVTFTCDVCVMIFNTKSALKKHKQKHAEKSKPSVAKQTQVNCKYCNIAFDSLILLTEHMHVEHDESAKPKSYKTKEKSREMSCTLCKKKFSNSSALSHHMGWHTRTPTTDDPKTAKIVKEKKIINKLARATKTKQPMEPPQFQCTTCFVVQPNETALQVHILEKHRNVSDIMLIPRCAVCNKDFATQDEYETHKRLHDFLERQKHHDQMVRETPPKKEGSGKVQLKSFPCKYCPAGFSRVDRLNGHVKQCHKEYVPNEFQCTQCDRVFDKRNSLSIHLKVHEKQRAVANVPERALFSCSICSMGFDVPNELRAHTISAHPF